MNASFYIKAIFILCLQFALLNLSAQQTVPSKKDWTVSSSKDQEDRFKAIYAIDGDSTTRWSSAWSDKQWFQIDTGAVFECSGMRIHWNEAYGTNF